MAKYDPLREHLERRSAARVSMTFQEIEQVLGSPLPRSARDHAAWWSNERSPTAHVQKLAWQAAGYDVESVDRAHGRVIFVRAGAPNSPLHASPVGQHLRAVLSHVGQGEGPTRGPAEPLGDLVGQDLVEEHHPVQALARGPTTPGPYHPTSAVVPLGGLGLLEDHITNGHA